jgi:hypothetical protein
VYSQRLSQRTIGFTQRQTHAFKLMLGRRALHGVASSLFMQYSSIYATLLGADPVQLGSLQSTGNAIGAVAAIPAGWFIDYYSLKKVFLLSTWEVADFFTPAELGQLVRFAAGGSPVKVAWRTTLWPLWSKPLPLPWGGFIGMAATLS